NADVVVTVPTGILRGFVANPNDRRILRRRQPPGQHTEANRVWLPRSERRSESPESSSSGRCLPSLNAPLDVETSPTFSWLPLDSCNIQRISLRSVIEFGRVIRYRAIHRLVRCPACHQWGPRVTVLVSGPARRRRLFWHCRRPPGCDYLWPVRR